jgi:chromosome segregation ATPase
MSEYSERNPIKLGDYYTKHIMAMTAEGLHDKSAIAAELAYRDKLIDEFEADCKHYAEDCNTALNEVDELEAACKTLSKQCVDEAAEIGELNIENKRLRSALTDMVKRFHRCAEVVGNSPEYIEMATSQARKALKEIE